MVKRITIFAVVLLLLSISISIALPVESHPKANKTLIIGFEERIPEEVYKKYTVLDENEELNCILVKTTREERIISESLAGMKYVEENKLVHAVYAPNDPRFDEQWGLKCINVDRAWDIEKGCKNTSLAILDTGINSQHGDLGNYVSGFDFVNNDTNPMDDNGHGTEVAGVAAATINNGKGIAGIAQVNILALKVLNESGWGTNWDVARAITYAANHSAVISMSFGGDDSEIMWNACSYAWNKGSILVAASGNEHSSIIYPAAYPTVIAVGAIDEDKERASYSNFGHELELVAPGNSILTTYLNGGYGYFSGTSAATPHVSGVAALLKSKYLELSNKEVRNRLRNTAKDLGKEGKDDYYGYGLVNASTALSMGIRVFDTSEGTYPSIMGTHKGIIKPSSDITVNKMYTYPCAGTGGHSEYVKIWNSTWNVTANWSGYGGDWHNIIFDTSFTLKANESYNYTIKTGSYPQIHHIDKLKAASGTGEITCDKFIDANGKVYYDWIPTIRLYF